MKGLNKAKTLILQACVYNKCAVPRYNSGYNDNSENDISIWSAIITFITYDLSLMMKAR